MNARIPDNRRRPLLPFFVEFVKFASGFVAIVVAALLALHIATVATL